MFSFMKKEINMEAVNQYWDWFVNNEQWIIDNFDTHGIEIVDAIDTMLKPVFPYFKSSLEFDFTYHKGEGEFNFYYMNKRNLLHDAKILKDRMPIEIARRWKFNISR